MLVELYQTGAEPEFFITTLAKIEPMVGGFVRLYLSSERENHQRLEYTAVIPAQAMTVMAHLLLAAASNLKEQVIRLGELPTAH